MLKCIVHEHNKPRLIGFTSSVDGSTSIIGTSSLEASSVRNGTGDHSLTFTKPFSRAPVIVSGITTSALPGGYPSLQTTPTVSSARFLTHRATDGLPSAGVIASLVLGWDSSDTDVVSQQRLKTDRKGARLIALQVDTTAPGTISLGQGDLVLTRNGTGDVTLSFVRAFQPEVSTTVTATPLVAVGTAVSATPSVSVQSETTGVGSIRFKTWGPTSGAVDAVFNAFVLGFDFIGPTINNPGEVQTAQNRPRLIAGRILISAGAPSVSIGAGDYTVADTGTGQVTVNITRPFLRAPVVIASAENSADSPGRLTVSSSTLSSFLLNTGDAATGALTDMTSGGAIHFMALGFDDPTNS